MTTNKRFKLFRAQRAFDRNAEYLRNELRGPVVAHLLPVLEYLEYLVTDMAEIAGVTLEVKGYAARYSALRADVMAHRPPRAPKPPKTARPRLRLIQGGR